MLASDIQETELLAAVDRLQSSKSEEKYESAMVENLSKACRPDKLVLSDTSSLTIYHPETLRY